MMPFLLSILLITAHTLSHTKKQDLDRLKEQLKNDREAFRNIIEKDNKNSIQQLQNLDKKITDLEKDHGIEQLQKKISELRLESCKIQEEDPDLKKLRLEQKKIIQDIEKETRKDREKIDNLTQETEHLQENDPQYKEVQKKLSKLQEQLDKKIHPGTQRLEALNEKIFENPKIRKLFEEARPIEEALNKKYNEIREQMEPLNKELIELIQKVNKRLVSQDKKLKKLRTSIFSTRKEIFETDPCSMTQIITDQERDWLEFFL